MREDAEAARELLRADFLAAEQKYLDDELAALLNQFDVSEVEYGIAQAQVADMTGVHYAELVALAEELGLTTWRCYTPLTGKWRRISWRLITRGLLRRRKRQPLCWRRQVAVAVAVAAFPVGQGTM